MGEKGNRFTATERRILASLSASLSDRSHAIDALADRAATGGEIDMEEGEDPGARLVREGAADIERVLEVLGGKLTPEERGSLREEARALRAAASNLDLIWKDRPVPSPRYGGGITENVG